MPDNVSDFLPGSGSRPDESAARRSTTQALGRVEPPAPVAASASAATGPGAAVPGAAGPVVAGPVVAGPVVAGPVVAGPVVAGPAAAGSPADAAAAAPPAAAPSAAPVATPPAVRPESARAVAPPATSATTRTAPAPAARARRAAVPAGEDDGSGRVPRSVIGAAALLGVALAAVPFLVAAGQDAPQRAPRRPEPVASFEQQVSPPGVVPSEAPRDTP